MSFAPGSRLGPFEILAPLGAGGMGEVYRARDTRLNRNVAIKLLPEAVASNRDRLSRFEQEARSASALNHPNIVTIYELGNSAPHHYIAMELVDGKTLRELLGGGPMPMRRVLDIGVQVSEGLTKAHEAGITHRDLKPENLMVTSEGLVKILDFGLAKIAANQTDDGQTATSSGSPTASGAIIGTVGYMSPEQVAGQSLNFHSDQFSLGLVLYEMVAGKRAFQRPTAAETMVAILREPVEPAGAVNREAPAPLCWLIERCLNKSADKRYVSTRELARELAAIRDRFSEKQTAPAEAKPANLPVPRTGFVGRGHEVATAREMLKRPEVRLITVTGPGGIGKTRLAIEVAGGLASLFPAGIHFVPLSPLSEPAMIASAIAQTLGLRELGGQTPQELLRKSLQESLSEPLLLLLDNFEHLMQAAPFVADLLAMGPNLKILVTSRAPLRIYGEHEFPVSPLGLPDPRIASSVDVLADVPAIALFLQRAVAAKPGFELNRENAAAVVEICARLDGLPLAIELAAARVKVLTPAAMLSRLASRLQLLTGGARDLPQRQQTLRAALDWSYDLLSPAEQRLFRRLSVFVGGCNLEGIEAVCDTKGDLDLDLLDGMASLVDKSLVRQTEEASGDSRFSMLETMREYGLDKLRANGEEAATRRAHAAYCLVLAEEQSHEQTSSETPGDLEQFEFEHNNFRAALEWLIETGDADWGLRLGTALFRFWENREYFAEGRDKLGKLLHLEKAAVFSKARMRALFAAGVLAGQQGDYAAASGLIGESRSIAQKLGDNTGLAISLNALAVFARDRGDLDLARDLFQQSLDLWRDLGDLIAVARALNNLASVMKLRRDFERARALHSECLAIFRGLRDRTGVAWSLNNQGDVARDQGELRAAQELYEQALAMFRELGDHWGLAGTLADLGNLAREERDYDRAHSLYRESLKHFQDLGHKRGVARLLECFASSEAAQGQAEQALRHFGAAAALRTLVGAPLTPTEQEKLDSSLEPSRKAISTEAGAAAWLEGWTMPMEQAVAQLLSPRTAATLI
jgi:predicted ATPase